MINDGKPFTPETLATRWDCSAQHIRNMIDRGELAGFKLGNLHRIAANVVETIECGSSCTEEHGAHTGEKKADPVVFPFAHPAAPSQSKG